eukprot:COSAG06_NODE_57575_length_280_cov_0.558011_1_plen_43_part_01
MGASVPGKASQREQGVVLFLSLFSIALWLRVCVWICVDVYGVL